MSIEFESCFPDQFKMVPGPEGLYASKLISLRDFPPGQKLAQLGEECKISHKAYTSVQFANEADGKSAHFELGSELVYINHSCNPNVAFELPGGWRGLEEGRWCLRSLSEIKKGDALNFAYFSTEWDMDTPFQCLCCSEGCLGEIRGAKHMSKKILDKYFINEHIEKMITADQQCEKSST
ncbi:hypothetical protein Pst134EB_026443 [Puccinia striiformis f. sp. tritici]|nr:hypothetical protein Pst134EB_026443 [Puccinia striiformis f. sp. tritici]